MVDERIIHEWLFGDLKGQEWTLARDDRIGLIAAVGSEGYCIHNLLPLDMNTWDAECVPRLRHEGYQVDMWTNEGTGTAFGCHIWGYASGQFNAFTQMTTESIRQACYAALTVYLKGGNE